ncbi:hypothetical protein FHK99_07710 [Cylindrospermopsis raciborskii CS-506_B]|nr:hypothetical protein [Cylindrospermopsis raciborskii CS-506_B]
MADGDMEGKTIPTILSLKCLTKNQNKYKANFLEVPITKLHKNIEVQKPVLTAI